MTVLAGNSRRSPFSHGWYATTARPSWGIPFSETGDFRHFWPFGACRLRGKHASSGTADHVCQHGRAGATLDTQAAAIMISQYRQNNGLGTVVVDPDLVKLAEQQSQAMAAKNKMDHDVKAPLGKRLEASGYPATRQSRMSRPAITPWRKHFRAGGIRRRTGPICSKTVSQNWASPRAMRRTPSTRCSGRSFWRQHRSFA